MSTRPNKKDRGPPFKDLPEGTTLKVLGCSSHLYFFSNQLKLQKNILWVGSSTPLNKITGTSQKSHGCDAGWFLTLIPWKGKIERTRGRVHRAKLEKQNRLYVGWWQEQSTQERFQLLVNQPLGVWELGWWRCLQEGGDGQDTSTQRNQISSSKTPVTSCGNYQFTKTSFQRQCQVCGMLLNEIKPLD